METTYETLQQLEEHFHKLQLSDQNNFQDRLDSLQVCIYSITLVKAKADKANTTCFTTDQWSSR